MAEGLQYNNLKLTYECGRNRHQKRLLALNRHTSGLRTLHLFHERFHLKCDNFCEKNLTFRWVTLPYQRLLAYGMVAPGFQAPCVSLPG